MDVSIGIVFAWLAIATTGQVFATIIARRARKNRIYTQNMPATSRLMAWSIEIDAILTVILLTFMFLAGIATVPLALGYLISWGEFIRVVIVRPLVVASLSTTVIRLMVMYGFLKIIEERQREDEFAE